MSDAPAIGPLGECLLAKVREAFPEHAFVERPEPNLVVAIQSPHPDVGRLSLWDDGDELMVSLDRFTHFHIESHDEDLDKAGRRAAIVDAAVAWLHELFADRIEFYGAADFAGSNGPRDGKPRGRVSRWLMGRSYVWSGPLEPGA